MTAFSHVTLQLRMHALQYTSMQDICFSLYTRKHYYYIYCFQSLFSLSELNFLILYNIIWFSFCALLSKQFLGLSSSGDKLLIPSLAQPSLMITVLGPANHQYEISVLLISVLWSYQPLGQDIFSTDSSGFLYSIFPNISSILFFPQNSWTCLYSSCSFG